MSEYIERYWRDAKPEDAIKEPPMLARFRDSEVGQWRIAALDGHNRAIGFKWGGAGFWWRTCQVYDAPDPGEGWRLIDPGKDDYNQNGIEYWNIGQKRWLPRYLHNDKTSFLQDGFYRIRIEQPKPKYVPFEWEDREELKLRWIRYSSKGQTVVEICVKFTNDEDGFLINDTYNYWLLDNATFLDTGEPVGKKVTQ